MMHRVVILLAGVVSGAIAAANFARRGFTLSQALHEPTIVSTVLLVEGVVCPVLGLSCFLCHGDANDPNTCMFSVPEERSEIWTVCDDMCRWSTCDDMKKEHGLNGGKRVVIRQALELYRLVPLTTKELPQACGRVCGSPEGRTTVSLW